MSVHPSILLEHLGLPHAAAATQPWLDRAAHEGLSYADCLEAVREEDLVARKHAAAERRLRAVGFPYAASIEQFDFCFQPELKRQVVLRYLDPGFVERAVNLVLIGAPGLGKTLLAVCVATKQIQLGYT